MLRVHKRVGETPLQALERTRHEQGIQASVPMTYAGRLDPLAEGELIILVGEECKEKERYLHADKEYEVDILFGVSTDTGDPMGIITHVPGDPWNLSQGALEQVLARYVGNVSWPYPAFSSKPVQGKPLFLWSLEGRIGEVEIPIRESTIYTLVLIRTYALSTSALRQIVMEKIGTIIPDQQESKRLGADFRRGGVLVAWHDMFQAFPHTEWHVATIRCTCSSGTYMRTLAEQVGKAMGTNALALHITRTRIMI